VKEWSKSLGFHNSEIIAGARTGVALSQQSPEHFSKLNGGPGEKLQAFQNLISEPPPWVRGVALPQI